MGKASSDEERGWILAATSGYKCRVVSVFCGDDMKLPAVVAFACLSAASLPAFAEDQPVPSPQFPGWVTKVAETETVFYYCVSPKICGKDSIVSFHFHDLPAPSKADIRARQKEPRLPITCKNAGS